MREYVAGRPSWKTARSPHVIVAEFPDRREKPNVRVVDTSKVSLRDEHRSNLFLP
jgi:hypothetical protein